MRLILLGLTLLSIFSSCSRPRDYSSIPANAPYEKDFTPLTSIMQNNLTQLGGNAGLLIMYKDGTPLYKKYFGAYNDSTILPISTASNWLSATTILTLVNQDYGPIKLDDRVYKFYPNEYASSDRNNITIRQLLNHTSGFSTSSSWVNVDTITLQQAAKGIGTGGNLGNTFTPPASITYAPTGSKFAFSAAGMQVAGAIAEKIGNRTWETLFRDNIADRVGMPSTNYAKAGTTSNPKIADGAATRMMELGNFLLMLINSGSYHNEQMLPLSSLSEMFKDQVNNIPVSYSPYSSDTMRIKYKYGLGCWIEEYKNGAPTAFGAQGVNGFSAWVDKGRNVIGVLFVNRTLDVVNTQPTIDAAPYTLIRKKVAEILDK